MQLDIRRLHRAGLLEQGSAGAWKWTVGGMVRSTIGTRAGSGNLELSFIYTPRGSRTETIDQVAMLEATPCTFGGNRSWFTCRGSSGRVAVICGAGRFFACRPCKGLAYASQIEGDEDRDARRADGIRKRLGWPAGIFNPRGGMPKSMHRRSFDRLVGERDR